jgi:hypothetical protein
MAKEYEGFKKTYKSLEQSADKYTLAAVAKLGKRVIATWEILSDIQLTVRAAAGKAVRDGVDPSDLGKLMGHPAVKELLSGWNEMANRLDEDIKIVDTFTKEASDLCDDIKKLYGKIEDDLEDRKDSSESKKDIAKLKLEVEKTYKSVKEAHLEAPTLVGAKMRDYGKKLVNEIKDVLKEGANSVNEFALKEQELDYDLRDRVLARNMNEATSLRIEVVEACEEAVNMLPNNRAGAAEKVKGLAASMKRLTELGRDHAKLKSENLDMLQRNKKGPMVIKALDSIIDSLATANKAFNATILAIRKVG